MSSTQSISLAVRKAFDASELIISCELALDQYVADVKALLSANTGVPVLYQTLLQEGDVVPLRNDQSLLDAGLQSDSVLLLIQKDPRHPERDLWDLCVGCRCDFDDRPRGYRPGGLSGLCPCNARLDKPHVLVPDSTVAPPEGDLRYLLRAIKGETPSLQTMFERAVLSGRFTFARILAEDPRVDVNAENEGMACEECCGNGITLVELAAEKGQTDICSLLIETGKLNLHSAVNASAAISSRMFWTGQRPSVQQASSWLPLFAMIQREGWSGDDAFCDKYLEIVHRTIASKIEELENERCEELLPNGEFHGDEWNSCHGGRQARIRRYLVERDIVAENMGMEPLNCRGPKRK